VHHGDLAAQEALADAEVLAQALHVEEADGLY